MTKITYCIILCCGMLSGEPGARQVSAFLGSLFPALPAGGAKVTWWKWRWGGALSVGGILTCSSLGRLQSSGTGGRGGIYKATLFSPYEKVFVPGVKRLPQGRSGCSVWDGWMPMQSLSPFWLICSLVCRALFSEACRTQIPPGVYTPSCPAAPGHSSHPVVLGCETSSSWPVG